MSRNILIEFIINNNVYVFIYTYSDYVMAVRKLKVNLRLAIQTIFDFYGSTYYVPKEIYIKLRRNILLPITNTIINMG